MKNNLVRLGSEVTVTGGRARKESLRGKVVAMTDCLFVVQAKNFKEAFRLNDVHVKVGEPLMRRER